MTDSQNTAASPFSISARPMRKSSFSTLQPAPKSPSARWRIPSSGTASTRIMMSKRSGPLRSMRFKRFAETPGFDAISITTHGASAALLGADGTLAMPVIDYEHEYPQDIRDAYTALRPPFEETYSPRQSMGLNVGAQLHYQKTAFPAEFAKVATILTYPQYWAARLTGVAANEADLARLPYRSLESEARRIFLAGRYARHSRSDGADPLGLRCARSRPAGDRLRHRPCRRYPVYCGIHDFNASLLPHLVDARGALCRRLDRNLGRSISASAAISTILTQARCACQCRCLRPRGALLALHGRPRIRDSFSRNRPCPTERRQGSSRRNDLEGHDAAAERGPGFRALPGRDKRWLTLMARAAAERYAAMCLYLALMTRGLPRPDRRRGVPIIVEGPFALNETYLTIACRIDRPRRRCSARLDRHQPGRLFAHRHKACAGIGKAFCAGRDCRSEGLPPRLVCSDGIRAFPSALFTPS